MFLEEFIRMYRPHVAREGHAPIHCVPANRFCERVRFMGEEFEKRERTLFGQEGFEKYVGRWLAWRNLSASTISTAFPQSWPWRRLARRNRRTFRAGQHRRAEPAVTLLPPRTLGYNPSASPDQLLAPRPGGGVGAGAAGLNRLTALRHPKVEYHSLKGVLWLIQRAT